MPVFEYKCADCGKISEFLERNSSQKKKNCPGCGSDKMQKLPSTFAGIVKHKPESQACDGCPSGSCPYSGG